MEKKISQKWLERDLIFKTGKIAQQATASVMVQYGETVVLATVVESESERAEIDYFPLMVDIEEKLYAAGIIKGSRWIKREGRPTDESVLTGRMIDRSIRPLFLSESLKDVQVLLTLLSVDHKNDHDIVSLLAASAVLSISGIEWEGPIGGIRVGRVDGKMIFNPTYEERILSDLDYVVAGTEEKVVMIEGNSKEASEEDVYQAIYVAQNELQVPIKAIQEFKKVVLGEVENKIKEIKKEEDENKMKVKNLTLTWLKENLDQIFFNTIQNTKKERKNLTKEIKQKINEYLISQEVEENLIKWAMNKIVDDEIEKAVSEQIIKNEKRVDGRGVEDLREIKSEVAFLPRVHGSGLFSRGETQILSIVTLGSPGLQQQLEGVEGYESKRYMHHYNFAPFSVGEARPMRGPGRREVGHGALAEKALMPVLPSEEEFPYTIRVVSETLGSNGSSSMASACASTLALMDAGVPIKKKVAGVAIGLASNKDMSEWQVITDLQDLEDGKGGMDFKVAGTKDGITVIQMDTKTNGLTFDIIKEALRQAKNGRLKILQIMDQTILEPRAELSPYAPRLVSFMINPAKIREVIGTGGKVIQKIIADYEVTVDVEDDGRVVVGGIDVEKVQAAVKVIQDIVREFEVGERFLGKVVRLTDFGAFIQIAGNTEGLLHVSEFAPYRVEKVTDFFKEGDEVSVQVREINDKGQVSLTMKGIEENELIWATGRGKSNINSSSSSRFGSNGASHSRDDRGRGGYSNRPNERRPRY